MKELVVTKYYSIIKTWIQEFQVQFIRKRMQDCRICLNLYQLLDLLLGTLVHCIVLDNSLFTDSVLHIYKSIVHLCIEYCCQIKRNISAMYLDS